MNIYHLNIFSTMLLLERFHQSSLATIDHCKHKWVKALCAPVDF